MKYLPILFIVFSSLAACTSRNDVIIATDTISENGVNTLVNQTICFEKLSGTAGQDTTFLKLNIDREQVSGDFAHYPHEKDRRVGTIRATKKNELIKGLWIYTQEGINDTLQVEFKFSGDKLVQKNYTIDSKTGLEVFSDASVFNIEFRKIDCSN